MNLRIIKPGISDSIQDVGRFGWQHVGIGPGGAMDKYAAALANILVGNERRSAVLELHFPAAAFFFEQPALIALAGADFSPTINGEDVPLFQPILLNKYSILQFQKMQKGARCYLAIHGGLDVPPWLNSLSTNLKARAGGLHGRTLQKDDEIKLRMQLDFCSLIGKSEFRILPWKLDHKWTGQPEDSILIVAGNEMSRLTEESTENFYAQKFIVSNQSDRMGYGLIGTGLISTNQEDLISSPVQFGTIQLLPNGQLMVLMADHQTTGGYPRIAHVITASHSKLAQLKPGDTLNFQLVEMREAETFLIKQHQHLLHLENACKFRLEDFINANNRS